MHISKGFPLNKALQSLAPHNDCSIILPSEHSHGHVLCLRHFLSLQLNISQSPFRLLFKLFPKPSIKLFGELVLNLSLIIFLREILDWG